MLNARYFFPSASLSAQSGYLHNRMNYRNKISGINSVNLIDGSLNNLKYEYQGIRNLLISASAGIDLYRARSDNFGGSHSRRQGTACLGLNYQATGRMHLNMMLREQIINGEWAPVAPALGMNYRLLEKEALNFTANIARNFHAPTLNDLYWTPGGNPDLGFEKGFSFDLGLKYDKQIGSYQFHAAITHFYADINNWIIWLPDSVFSYWTPANLKRVVSRGIESEAAVSANYGNWNWKYTLFYSYTSAKNQTRSGSADLSAGRQLIYVPENLLNQNLYVRCRGFSVSWHLNLTGRRYTASDNSRYLPAFSTQDLNVAKQVNLKKSIFELRLIVNNILNENYQVVAWHPMPGRSFTFSLKYIFNQNH